MRAAMFESYGGPEVLTVGERPDPVVGPDVVLVRVRATSVNPVDWKIREGFLQERYPHHLPITPGWDVAGVVEKVGPAVVTGVQEGDEVWGYVRRDDVSHGTAAELVAAPERTVSRKPAGLSFEEAASVPLAGSHRLAVAHRGAAGRRGRPGAGPRRLGRGRPDGRPGRRGAGRRGHRHRLPRQPRPGPLARRHHRPRPRRPGRSASSSADHGGPVDAVLDLIGGDALADAPARSPTPRRIVSVIDPQTVIGMGGRYVFVRPERAHLDALGRPGRRGQAAGHRGPDLRPRRHRRGTPALPGGPPRRQDRDPGLRAPRSGRAAVDRGHHGGKTRSSRGPHPGLRSGGSGPMRGTQISTCGHARRWSWSAPPPPPPVPATTTTRGPSSRVTRRCRRSRRTGSGRFEAEIEDDDDHLRAEVSGPDRPGAAVAHPLRPVLGQRRHLRLPVQQPRQRPQPAHRRVRARSRARSRAS